MVLMWTGWKSIKAGRQMTQSVQCMRNIQLPPTRDEMRDVETNLPLSRMIKLVQK